jgi:MSHA pilin protein MshC
VFKRNGFTLVEIVMVIVVVGILATVAAGRMADTKVTDAIATAELTRSTLRFGQRIAVAQNRSIFVRLDGVSVALCYDNACNNKVLPAGGSNSGRSATLGACGDERAWACEGFGADVGYSENPAQALFIFDARGKPYASSDTVTSGISSFSTLALTFSANGNNSVVTVEAETGYVH